MNAPDKATEIKAWITAVIAFMTVIWGWVGWAVAIMIGCMLLDYLTGTWAAKATGTWSSSVARDGLWHKLGEIVALLVAILCDIALQVILNSAVAPLFGEIRHNEYLTLIVAIWYTFTELGSILENIQKLGAPIPEWLVSGVKKMKTKAETPKASAYEFDQKAEPAAYTGKHETGSVASANNDTP